MLHGNSRYDLWLVGKEKSNPIETPCVIATSSFVLSLHPQSLLQSPQNWCSPVMFSTTPRLHSTFPSALHNPSTWSASKMSYDTNETKQLRSNLCLVFTSFLFFALNVFCCPKVPFVPVGWWSTILFLLKKYLFKHLPSSLSCKITELQSSVSENWGLKANSAIRGSRFGRLRAWRAEWGVWAAAWQMTHLAEKSDQNTLGCSPTLLVQSWSCYKPWKPSRTGGERLLHVGLHPFQMERGSWDSRLHPDQTSGLHNSAPEPHFIIHCTTITHWAGNSLIFFAAEYFSKDHLLFILQV